MHQTVAAPDPTLTTVGLCPSYQAVQPVEDLAGAVVDHTCSAKGRHQDVAGLEEMLQLARAAQR